MSFGESNTGPAPAEQRLSDPAITGMNGHASPEKHEQASFEIPRGPRTPLARWRATHFTRPAGRSRRTERSPPYLLLGLRPGPVTRLWRLPHESLTGAGRPARPPNRPAPGRPQVARSHGRLLEKSLVQPTARDRAHPYRSRAELARSQPEVLRKTPGVARAYRRASPGEDSELRGRTHRGVHGCTSLTGPSGIVAERFAPRLRVVTAVAAHRRGRSGEGLPYSSCCEDSSRRDPAPKGRAWQQGTAGRRVASSVRTPLWGGGDASLAPSSPHGLAPAGDVEGRVVVRVHQGPAGPAREPCPVDPVLPVDVAALGALPARVRARSARPGR